MGSVLGGQIQVVLGVAHDLRVLLVGEGSTDLAGYAGHQGPRRDLGPFEHHAARGDQRALRRSRPRSARSRSSRSGSGPRWCSRAPPRRGRRSPRRRCRSGNRSRCAPPRCPAGCCPRRAGSCPCPPEPPRRRRRSRRPRSSRTRSPWPSAPARRPDRWSARGRRRAGPGRSRRHHPLPDRVGDRDRVGLGQPVPAVQFDEGVRTGDVARGQFGRRSAQGEVVPPPDVRGRNADRPDGVRAEKGMPRYQLRAPVRAPGSAIAAA